MAVVKVRNAADTGWIVVGGGVEIFQQDAEPGSTYPGQLWLDTDTDGAGGVGFPMGYISEYKLSSYTTTILRIENLALNVNDGSNKSLFAPDVIDIDVVAEGLATATVYFVYVDVPASGVALVAADIELSDTAPEYVNAKLGWYKVGDGTQRCIGEFTTRENGAAYDWSVMNDDGGSVIGAITWDTGTKKFNGSWDFGPNGKYFQYAYRQSVDQYAYVQGEDWTIATWAYTNNMSSTQGITSVLYDNGRYIRLFINTTGSVQFLINDDAGTINFTSATGLVTHSTWYHIAVVKKGVTWGIYINGEQVAWYASWDVDLNVGTDYTYMYVGEEHAGPNYFDGNLESLAYYGYNYFDATPNSGNTDTFTVPDAHHDATDNQCLYAMAQDNAGVVIMKPFVRVAERVTFKNVLWLFYNLSFYDFWWHTASLPADAAHEGISSLSLLSGMYQNSQANTQIYMSGPHWVSSHEYYNVTPFNYFNLRQPDLVELPYTELSDRGRIKCKVDTTAGVINGNCCVVRGYSLRR